MNNNDKKGVIRIERKACAGCGKRFILAHDADWCSEECYRNATDVVPCPTTGLPIVRRKKDWEDLDAC